MRKESTQEFEYQEARIIGIILAIVKDSYQTGFPEYFLSWILPLLSLGFLVQKLDFFFKDALSYSWILSCQSYSHQVMEPTILMSFASLIFLLFTVIALGLDLSMHLQRHF